MIKKILILFGSASDEPVTQPIVSALTASGFETELQYVSAHRNPEKLDTILKSTSFDLLVAGAGLAAHLPGVSASKIFKPVIGVPVDLAFGGVDAFLSILQMPPGIPVFTTPPANSKNSPLLWKKISTLLKSLNGIDYKQNKVHFVCKSKDFEGDLTKKPRAILAAAKVKVTNSEKPVSGVCNLVLVPKGKLSSKYKNPKNSFSILVPTFSKQELSKAASAQNCLKNINSSQIQGLWTGANNTVNATCAILEILNSNADGKYENLLSQVKKGEFRA